jgi:hypothetical protein
MKKERKRPSIDVTGGIPGMRRRAWWRLGFAKAVRWMQMAQAMLLALDALTWRLDGDRAWGAAAGTACLLLAVSLFETWYWIPALRRKTAWEIRAFRLLVRRAEKG